MTGRRVATEHQHEYEPRLDAFFAPPTTHTMAAAPRRARVVVEGIVDQVAKVAWVGGPVTEVTLSDATGNITLVFFGNRDDELVRPGNRLVAAGAVGSHTGRHIILSPQLWSAPSLQRGESDAGRARG